MLKLLIVTLTILTSCGVAASNTVHVGLNTSSGFAPQTSASAAVRRQGNMINIRFPRLIINPSKDVQICNLSLNLYENDTSGRPRLLSQSPALPVNFSLTAGRMQQLDDQFTFDLVAPNKTDPSKVYLSLRLETIFAGKCQAYTPVNSDTGLLGEILNPEQYDKGVMKSNSIAARDQEALISNQKSANNPTSANDLTQAVIEKYDSKAKKWDDDLPHPAIPNKFYWWKEQTLPSLKGVWKIVPPVSCAVSTGKAGWGKVVRNNCGFRIEVIACSQSYNCPLTHSNAVLILDPYKMPRSGPSLSMEGFTFPDTERVVSVAACRSNTSGFDWLVNTSYSIWDLEVNANSPTVTCLAPVKEPFDRSRVKKMIWPIYQKFSMGKLKKEVLILED